MFNSYSPRRNEYVCFHMRNFIFITWWFLTFRIPAISSFVPFVLFIVQRLGNKYGAHLWFHIEDPSCVPRCDLVAQLCIPTCRRTEPWLISTYFIRCRWFWKKQCQNQATRSTITEKAPEHLLDWGKQGSLFWLNRQAGNSLSHLHASCVRETIHHTWFTDPRLTSTKMRDSPLRLVSLSYFARGWDEPIQIFLNQKLLPADAAPGPREASEKNFRVSPNPAEQSLLLLTQ